MKINQRISKTSKNEFRIIFIKKEDDANDKSLSSKTNEKLR
jgi:hypothetical protein